jgi:glycosyltransferase involved in cell wall biosynthesis
MPRVLLTGFCAVPGPRRAGVQLRHVIRALTPLHTVDLLVVREGEQAYVERQGSVRVLRVPTHEADLRSQIQAFQRALKRQLDGADYDVVHCRDSWSGLPVLDARKRLGYAVVYDLTRSPLGETGLDPELEAQYGRDEEACILAADLVLAPTPAAVKVLQNRGRPERVMLSPPGVDVDRFDWDDMPSGGPPRILYVGSIDPGRGVRVLIRAMAAIVREVDARLVLAGSMIPKFEQALRDGIRELGLADKVDILGPVDHDQIPALIATASVCVVPAASDLSPNPTVVYPTKLLEYMACRRAIVAPRRETTQLVVDNNREALLFEPGDPLDLAKKVLRLVGEPVLRDRIANAGYERVRRDFTASASRRAVRKAYDVLASRFAERFAEEPEPEEAPKVELLADDDFEATVFEEAPVVRADTSVSHEIQIEDLVALDDHHTSSESVIAPPPPRDRDETMERSPVPPGPRDSGNWTVSVATTGLVTPAVDEWVVTNVQGAVRGIPEEEPTTAGDDGTPIEGVVAVAPALPVVDANFVAGEIDVPPSAPVGEKETPVDFTAASSLLGQPEPAEPDTGRRTPPIERR